MSSEKFYPAALGLGFYGHPEQKIYFLKETIELYETIQRKKLRQQFCFFLPLLTNLAKN